MDNPTNSKFRYFNIRGSGFYRRYVKTEKRILQTVNFSYQQFNTPIHGTYGALLFTPEWRSKREEILLRDNHHCVVCSNNKNLQVHHRQYHFIVQQNQFKQPWDYPNNLLITLCESCHKRGHNKHKVPTINI
jgi:hypothetical protein